MTYLESLRRRELSDIGALHLPRKVISSQYLVERLSLQHRLRGHRGCVNSIMFLETLDRVLTGSDDTDLNIFDISTGEMVGHIPTIHTNNIFWAKDLPGSVGRSILSCAADGRVIIHEDMDRETSSVGSSKVLFRHRGRAHRLDLMHGSYSCFFSCGEDGVVNLYDLRSERAVVGSTVFHRSGSKYQSSELVRGGLY